jgi:hypothetical protein
MEKRGDGTHRSSFSFRLWVLSLVFMSFAAIGDATAAVVGKLH